MHFDTFRASTSKRKPTIYERYKNHFSISASTYTHIKVHSFISVHSTAEEKNLELWAQQNTVVVKKGLLSHANRIGNCQFQWKEAKSRKQNWIFLVSGKEGSCVTRAHKHMQKNALAMFGTQKILYGWIERVIAKKNKYATLSFMTYHSLRLSVFIIFHATCLLRCSFVFMCALRIVLSLFPPS